MRLPTLTPHIAIQTFLLLSSIKWLLVPTYRSTDFDVHRLWLGITHHLPLDEWYYYDANGTTPHTLDYPPLFAFFEYALSNNFITSSLLKYGGDGSSTSASSSWLDEECLALLPVPTSDTTMATASASSRNMKVSDNCIRFHRGTVIISDVVLFVGAYMAATAVASTSTTMTTTPTPSEASVTSSTSKSSSWVAFILIVTNPGLLMLDHVHFQYNGMLLGVLLISISCIVRGASSSVSFSSPQQQQQQQNHDETQTHRNRRQEQLWELLGAGTFASLLALKHLYLTLAPLYFFYLLRRHCFIIVNDEKNGKPKYDTANINTQSSDNIIMNSSGDGGSSSSNTILMRQREVLRFSWTRLLVLGFVAVLCFLGPFVPFMIQSNNPVEQTQQILKRLFPFGRGLVHDYWAANVWALYMFGSRFVTFIFQRSPVKLLLPKSILESLDFIIPFPEPKPSLVAFFLLIGLWPGGIYMAWKIGNRSLVDSLRTSCGEGISFIHAAVFCSLSSFMVAYHVHEKAILTAIIPMTLLATSSRRATRLYLRTCTFGLFGLLPLLFRPEELLLKVVLFMAWMCGAIYILDVENGGTSTTCSISRSCSVGQAGQEEEEEEELTRRMTSSTPSSLLTKFDLISFVTLGSVLVFMEIIHPIVFLPSGRLEFLPLMATSVICAAGLIWCWLESYRQMRYHHSRAR